MSHLRSFPRWCTSPSDQPCDFVIGTWRDYPIKGTETFPSMIHVIGSKGRPFSSMTPDEIVALREERMGR